MINDKLREISWPNENVQPILPISFQSKSPVHDRSRYLEKNFEKLRDKVEI